MSLEDNKQEIEVQETDTSDEFSFLNTPSVGRGVKKKRLFKSQTRSLLIAISVSVVAAILAGSVLLVLNDGNSSSTSSGEPSNDSTVDSPNNVTSTPEESANIVVFDHSKDNTKDILVKSVALSNSNGKFLISYSKDKEYYQLDAYRDLPLSENVADLIESCITLKAFSKITTGLADKEVGLDAPIATAAITYHDGTVTTLQIGKETPTKSGHYMRLAGTKDVYVLDADTVIYYLSADWWYVSTTLFTAPTRQEGDETGTAILKELALTGHGYKYDMHIRRPNVNDSAELAYFKYLTTKPFLRGVTDSVGDALYGSTSLYASKAAILHPTAEQKKKLGFNDPMAIATITLAIENQKTTDDGTFDATYYNHCKYVLRVGGTDADGNYWVMIDGVDVIYMIEKSTLSTLIERTHENTTTSLLFLKDVSTISKIKMSFEGKDYIFELSHFPTRENENDKLYVYVDGKKLDTANFRKLYVLMMGLYRYGRLETAPTGTPQCILTLYDNEESEVLSIRCYSTDGAQCEVQTSDGELFTIKASSITNLIAETKKFLNGEDVVS